MADKSSNVTETLPKWQIALAVGTPVAIGLAGLWYYKYKKSKRPSVSEGKAEKSLEGENKQTPDEAKVSHAC